MKTRFKWRRWDFDLTLSGRRSASVILAVTLGLNIPARAAAFPLSGAPDLTNPLDHLAGFFGETEEGICLPLPAPPPAMRFDPSFRPRTLAFEPNAGQAHPEVKFLARAENYALFLTATETVIVLNPPPRQSAASDRAQFRMPNSEFRRRDYLADSDAGDRVLNRETDRPGVVRMRLMGVNSQTSCGAEQKLPGKIHYFIGNDPARWRTNISTFARVRYRDVYPGIDLIYYGNDAGRLEYDLIVAPGADPGAITLSVEGADDVRLSEFGDLILTVGGRELRWLKPNVYQNSNGGRVEVASHYSVRQSQSRNETERQVQIRFQTAAYDRSRALVIDPVLLYSTLFGGNAPDYFSAMTTDAAGNLYLAGTTSAIDFPLKNEFQQFAGGENDMVVTKFSRTGELVYSTYLGGIPLRESALGIAVDSTLNAWIAGYTLSPNFPLQNAFQTNYGSGQNGDAFVAKLSAEGSSLIFSSYLGGSANDLASGIAIDAEGNAFVAGYTSSSRAEGFPVKNALQPERKGGQDAFIAKLKPNGSILYCTYFGGSARDSATSVAVGRDGSAWLAGSTGSLDLPLKNAFQARFAGGFGDGFIAKLNSDGTELLYSTYFGGSDDDEIVDLALGPEGEPYVLGLTVRLSANLPLKNPLQPSFGGRIDAFVARFTPDASGLVFSTYLGGRESELPKGLEVDGDGNAHVLLMTKSPDLPTVEPLFPLLQGDWDGYVAVFNPEGSKLLFATYFGGAGIGDHVHVLALDRDRNIYLSGYTWADDFPLLNPQQSELKGGGDPFIAKISPVSVRPPSLRVSRVDQTLVFTWPAVEAGFILESAGSLSLPEWLSAPTQPIVIGDQQGVVVEIEGRTRFYRLRKP